jgi:hypothetical protein
MTTVVMAQIYNFIKSASTMGNIMTLRELNASGLRIRTKPSMKGSLDGVEPVELSGRVMAADGITRDNWFQDAVMIRMQEYQLMLDSRHLSIRGHVIPECIGTYNLAYMFRCLCIGVL